MHFLPFCVDLNISHYYDQYCIRRAMYKYSYRLCFNSLGDFAVELCKWQHRLYRFQHGLETPIKLILTSTSGRVISVLRLLRCSCISMNRKDHFSG